jgi:integrase/recombinase XerD
MKLTYSIKAVLRPDKIKESGEVPIYLSIRVGPTTTRIPTGKAVKPADWSTKTGMPNKNTKLGQLLNTYLNQQISGWETYMLTEENLGKPITLTMAVNYFKQHSDVTLFNFIEEQIMLWQGVKKKNTLLSYESTLKILRKFNSKLNFGDLTYDTIQKFDKYLRDKRGNSTNGAFVKLKNLKLFVNTAILKGYMNESPFKHFKIKSTPGDRKWLTIDEIKILMTLKVPEKEVFLNDVRDMFLLSCFSGLRYSDIVNLTWGDIKQNPNRIEIKVEKTQRPIMVPLNLYAEQIIAKRSKLAITTPNQKVMPQISNQVANRDIKVLVKRAGINKHISFHCARHSFASNHVQNNTNILVIKQLLGHSKLEQTQIYAKNLTSDLFESVHKLEDMYAHAI